jgi:phosphoenolpyruvate synthase/pyruvate phosphate dikinase
VSGGFPVPAGFVVTADAYLTSMEAAAVRDELRGGTTHSARRPENSAAAYTELAGPVGVATPVVAVEAANRLGMTSSLCRQAPWNKPAFAGHLVRFGIRSVSVDSTPATGPSVFTPAPSSSCCWRPPGQDSAVKCEARAG